MQAKNTTHMVASCQGARATHSGVLMTQGVPTNSNVTTTVLLLFTSAEEAQNLTSLVASIWASSNIFVLFYDPSGPIR